jgi:hypothetical protein
MKEITLLYNNFNEIFFDVNFQGENADENEAQLDEEMDKVFSEPGLSKFDVRKLSDINKPASSTKLDEATPPANVKDYDCKYCLQLTVFKGLLQI